MKILLTLFLLLAYLPVGAFNKADQLKHAIAATSDPARRLELLLDFCEENRTYAHDTFNKYAVEALNLALARGNELQQARAWLFMALRQYKKSNLDSVLQVVRYIEDHFRFSEKERSFTNRIEILKASTYLKQNKHKAALDLFYKIADKTVREADQENYIKSINGIGWVEMELGRYLEASAWFRKGLAQPIAEPSPIAAILYNNLASCMGATGHLDSAQYYVEKAIQLARNQDDLPGLANALNILSSCYIETGYLDKAIACVQESMQVRERIGDPFFVLSDMAQQAFLYTKINKPQEAVDILHRAIDYATERKIEVKLPLLYMVLANTLYDNKDYKGSADALFVLQKLQDSLYKKNSANALAELQVKYESARQAQIIQKQQFELDRKNYWLFGTVALALLIVLLILVAFRNRKHKQKVKLQQVVLQQQEMATRSILEAEENERKRIASDLHDGLGQLLTAARFNLNGIADNLQSLPAEERLIFEKALSLVDESCREVRNVSHNIMPNALIKSGLGNAVKDFVERIENKKLQVHLSTSGLNEQLDSNIELVVYRIIQECVNNSIKHAQASRLDISLNYDAEGLTIAIEDNGIGFDRTAEGDKGMGMKNIRTRVNYLKGTLDVDTRKQQGTLIAVYIPARELKKGKPDHD
jgi:two-component system NarL family sensor kinase